MRFYQRLDFSVSVIVVVAMLLSFSLASWLYLRNSLIFYSPIQAPQANEMRGILNRYENNLATVSVDTVLQEFNRFEKEQKLPKKDYVFVLVDADYQVIAETSPDNTMIELVRPDAQDGYFAVTVSAVFEKADIFNIFVAVPGKPVGIENKEQYWLLAVPSAKNVPRTATLSSVMGRFGAHLWQFSWLYIGMVFIAIWVVFRNIKPLRKLESVAIDLSSNKLPKQVEGADDSEVGRIIRAFNIASEKLALNQKQKEQMISDIAHELRTPVTNILGRIEAQQEGVIDDKEGVIDFTFQQLNGLANIIEDMQLLNSADTKQLVIYTTPTNLDSLLQRWLQQYQHRQNLTFKLTVAENCNDVVLELDPQRIQQVLDNLLNNAVCAIPDKCKISICIYGGKEELYIDFVDNGPGVGKEHLSMLFERLYRADASRSAHTGGSGLGLSIVKSLIEAQDGSVSAFLPDEGGLGIRMCFPLEPKR